MYACAQGLMCLHPITFAAALKLKNMDTHVRAHTHTCYRYLAHSNMCAHTQGLTGLRPIPSAAALELENMDVSALAPQQPPPPASPSEADAGATNGRAECVSLHQ
eukprot:1139249-Pelagomonas_calceolata.AAC.5